VQFVRDHPAGERPFAVLGLAMRGGRIAELDIFADPERLSRLDLTCWTRDAATSR
jgi:hypothetical protein